MRPGFWRRSPLLIEAEFLEAFDAACGKAERGAVVGVADSKAATLGLELLGEFKQPFFIFAEHLDDAGDGDLQICASRGRDLIKELPPLPIEGILL
jgi:hypothetical protein